jgi:hypothetical protein
MITGEQSEAKISISVIQPHTHTPDIEHFFIPEI